MTIKRIGAVFAVVAALIVALTACVKSDNSKSGVFNDPKGSALDLPANPKVVALGWSDGAIALEFGVKPAAIYDWLGFGDATKGVGEWDADKFGADSPTLISAQSQGAFNYQQIQELKPDVILNVRAKNDSAVTDQLSKIAPVVTAPDGSGDFAVNWKTQTEVIGAALGKSDQAKSLIDATQATSDRLKSENPAFAGKTFTYGVKFGEAYGAYLAGDARFDIVSGLGFTQNPPVEKLQSSGFFASVPVERVGDLDSQVALFSTIGLPFADLQNDARINALNVVKDGRAVEIDGNDPSVQAMSAGTPVSLDYALDKVVPQLAAAAARQPVAAN
ncbi:MAG: ABC transporter substrate-binding protein [Gordonia sp. (in: high G+C Gram-positive bacteria)]|uniref:ABC transporter substrate-binding protein n=1 Tax=Gordonia sp. (in: high G+C Gram-positive bacteria) TaxID=84139 RepID=UPI0039E480B2